MSAGGTGATGSPVRVEVADGVATVVLDDPAHRNALSLEMVRAIGAAVSEALAAGSSAIVLANTPPVFCAGGSVDDLLAPRAPLEEMYGAVAALDAAPVPTVAAVDGAALGAGLTLALACDVVLCTPRSRFEVRFLDLGLHPGGGQLWRLRQRVGRQGASALALFGEAIEGEEAEARGLVWRCCDEAVLLPAAHELARRAAGRDPELLARVKGTLDASGSVVDRAEAVTLELGPQAWSMQRPAFRDALGALRERLGRQT